MAADDNSAITPMETTRFCVGWRNPMGDGTFLPLGEIFTIAAAVGVAGTIKDIMQSSSCVLEVDTQVLRTYVKRG